MVKVIHHESLASGKEIPGQNNAVGANPATAATDSATAGVALDSLAPGQVATVLSIEAEHVLKLHLMELGFVAGSPIVFLMSTPFGDPNIYALRGTSIALRKSEARCIRVRT
jgi:ferrous iron transport protein A